MLRLMAVLAEVAPHLAGQGVARIRQQHTGVGEAAGHLQLRLGQQGAIAAGRLAHAQLVHHLLEARQRAHTREQRDRSEEHTSELQSLMRISYAVFCLKKKKHKTTITDKNTHKK